MKPRNFGRLRYCGASLTTDHVFITFAAMKLFRQLAILWLVFGLLTPGINAQTKPKPRPQLKPVPMNKGPLGAAGYLTLVPLDDRPAVGQFAQMIGAIADHQVTMPPRELLGRFTQAGDTAKLAEWLKAQDYSKTDALIVSLDMLAYGGLVASRVPNTTLDAAVARLEFFRWFKQKYPRVPVYVFSTIMRVAPTATAKTRGTHDKLARWAELMDRVPKTGEQKLADELTLLKRELEPQVIQDYLAARKRNLQVNLAALDLYRAGQIDEMILLQDDARQYGLHRQDQDKLRERLQQLKLDAKIPIYNGADEGALSLTSRAVLDKYSSKLRVAVVYSSEKSKQVIAPFEDHPLQFTVEHQVYAAGGVIVEETEPYDYKLFVNAPETTQSEFNQFVGKLLAELKAGRWVVLADVLFPAPHRSGADERLIEILKREKLFDMFAGYAAWNTAGNTLGTAIPQANMRVFYRQKLNDLLERSTRTQVAQLEFLLHRFAGDYLYHDVVRPAVNERLRAAAANDGTVTYELTPEKYAEANREVETKLRAELEQFFAEYFQGRTYPLAFQRGQERVLKINGLKDLKIYLPWARTFEVAVEFKLDHTLN
ncbi:MAG: DUF4127 family protein [Acidobacteria bacterium]|nr:DUF4127 family protein [Acidobacteriota bacterium]MBI3425306.1 DUF4127 family protein [Acidobacteriota bacterium]